MEITVDGKRLFAPGERVWAVPWMPGEPRRVFDEMVESIRIEPVGVMYILTRYCIHANVVFAIQSEAQDYATRAEAEAELARRQAAGEK